MEEAMLKAGPGKRLIVTVDEADRWHGRSLYLALLELFRHKGLASASVLRGIAGYSGHGPIHGMHLGDLVIDLPLRIEVVDGAEAIDRVLPDVYDMVERGLVETQDTRVIKAPEQPEQELTKREALMRLIGKAKMLQVYIGQDDKWEGSPLYEAIVKRARQLDIAGATVARGMLGYGAHKRVHRHKTLALSHDDPIVISAIDTEDKINQLLAELDKMVPGGCLLAVSDVTVVKYSAHPDGSASSTGETK
jgi:PII-like signaling protein